MQLAVCASLHRDHDVAGETRSPATPALLLLRVGRAFNQSAEPQSQHLAGCLQDLATSCNYLGRSVLGSCIIDGLRSHHGSVVNIYEDRGEKEKTKQQLWLHWIFVFMKSSSSSVFLTDLQAPGEDTLTTKCNILVESRASRGIPSIIGIVWPASCS